MTLITDAPETQVAPCDVPVAAPSAPTLTFWRWSVGQYHEMIRTGIIDEDDPVELLEGWIVKKMTKSPAHCVATQLLQEVLRRQAPDGYYVVSQDPITLSMSEPEPDAVVVRGNPRDYVERHPGPTEVGLVAEVTDSSLPRDRVFKKSLYAAAGIPVYWVVNLVDRRVEVYSGCTQSASGADYARYDFYGTEDSVPLVLEGRKVAEITVRSVLL